MMNDEADARRKAELGLAKVMTGKPTEQRKGDELIEEAASLDPDAVEGLRQQIRNHANRVRTFGR
jgi:hypothetical protein